MNNFYSHSSFHKRRKPTFIECLVIIAIIGIVIAMGISAYVAADRNGVNVDIYKGTVVNKQFHPATTTYRTESYGFDDDRRTRSVPVHNPARWTVTLEVNGDYVNVRGTVDVSESQFEKLLVGNEVDTLVGIGRFSKKTFISGVNI